jgi:hypothetical protein
MAEAEAAVWNLGNQARCPSIAGDDRAAQSTLALLRSWRSVTDTPHSTGAPSAAVSIYLASNP